MNKELRPWEVAKMIEEAKGPVELEVWSDDCEKRIEAIRALAPIGDRPFISKVTSWQHARLPQKPERRKITDRYRIMKRCRELDAQGNGILVRWGSLDWLPWMIHDYVDDLDGYQYTHLDDNGQPIGEPQDFWEEA